MYKMRKIILQHKCWLLVVLVAIAAYSAGEILKAYAAQVVFDSAAMASMELLKKAVVLVIIYLFVLFVTYTFLNFCKGRFVQKCMIDVKNQWFDDIQKKQLCDYDVQESSTYISHFTVDAVMVESDYVTNFLMLLQEGIGGLAALTVIFRVHYIFAVFLLLTFWLPLFISHLWKGRLTKTKIGFSESSGRLTATLKEDFAGFEVCRIFGIKEHVRSAFRKDNERVEAGRFQTGWLGTLTEISSATGSHVIFFFNFLMGAFLTIQGVITVGEIIKCNQLMNTALNPLYMTGTRLTKMKAADEVYQSVSEKLAARTGDKASAGISIECFKDNIHVKSVSLSRYEKSILKQVSVELKKNKKYLVVGESGSGKSTFLKLLLNQYNDYQGTITIDGEDIREIDKDSWYRCLSVVSQEDFVFHDTLYNNITLFEEYDKKDIDEILRMCELEGFVREHAEGLGFMIKENGSNISGGERQRICLARALLRKPSILLLDEATSAMNSEMALKVEENILALEAVTVVAISHRIYPETYNKYDQVIHFKKNTVEQVS